MVLPMRIERADAAYPAAVLEALGARAPEALAVLGDASPGASPRSPLTRQRTQLCSPSGRRPSGSPNTQRLKDERIVRYPSVLQLPRRVHDVAVQAADRAAEAGGEGGVLLQGPLGLAQHLDRAP